ncbi:endonuclease MutS2 [Helicobacter typhlonius]|uniref:endonuclease MutS2 n=1 Tax=Helicobacter typhlonius TaxID=76936 RepID=UPI0039C88002
MPTQEYQTLITRLDLSAFLEQFQAYFARTKGFIFNGDRQFYATILQELDDVPLSAPPKLASLDTPLMHLKKSGILGLDSIFACMQLVRYFLYLKIRILESTPYTQKWLDKIVIPNALSDIQEIFDDEGELKEGIYPDIDNLKSHIKQNKMRIDEQMRQILQKSAIAPYLVDHNVHYINEHECLLLKAGYNQVISGMVLERSHNGFFYLLPDSIITLKERQNTLKDSLQESLYKLCATLCATLHKHIPFLTFLNHAFDTFDHIYARLSFAKAYNLSFIYQLSKQKDIILHEFSHPTLANPKPISLEFNAQTLMITGVNAGGKTILLKSLLSACFLTKFLIPLKINAHRSQIPYFKHIVAILSDPQNSKNDISTFAGRMLEFSQILNTPTLLLGIDEIELGTDADEAASLYKVLLEHIMANGAHIVLTTHHKHLAALMAHNPKVQLCAAMYDIQNQKPLFSFLKGSIGKSYAFESAARYGIPHTLIQRAKEVYGEDKERLNELIERSSELEIALLDKRTELDSLIKSYENKILSLKEQEEAQREAFLNLQHHLESTYQNATQTLKSALKAKESKDIHKAFNKAHHILQDKITAEPPKLEYSQTFKVGDRVKYKSARGKIISIKGAMCFIELDNGVKLKEKLVNLKPLGATPPSPPPQTKIMLSHTKSVGVSCDLHGMRGDEAIDKLDEFLSSALIAGYDEVLVYHGIGSGILSKLVYDYLKSHPKVLSFSDAPAQMGGFGAKVIRL